MSEMRKRYLIRLVLRCCVFLLCCLAAVFAPEQFGVLEGMNFFQEFSWLHLLWLVWMIDMLPQILPCPNRLPLGSMKLFARRFRPARVSVDQEALRSYIRSANRTACLVFVLYAALVLAIGGLYRGGLVDKRGLFLFSVCFYVCDLICVLIWCPFRLMMGTRCCTTCRIFNWDHLMMFSPLIFMGGFYAVSLVVMAAIAWLVWEAQILLHPERFWEKSNAALRCSECTDKLCTQYCQKLRRR